MNEREIIAHLRRLFPRAGDDAAIVDERVITNDMLVEDVDFTRAIPLEFIARKSLAVNLSDLAAMGAKPEWAVVALGIP
ncbi:MAG: AIR synthase related protein, partial [Thermoanaerobaculia bacterium]